MIQLDPDVDGSVAQAVALSHSHRMTSQPSRSYFVTKRALDLLGCLFLAPVALVFGLILAAIIKLQDGGPVLFVQWRTGQHGHRFKMYKFRSMCPDAEARKADLWAQSVVAYPDFKLIHDPRVTPIGRLMRKCFLDELPQLINVLKGDMSFVGPRPTSFTAASYDLWHTVRLDARPGITGLWQLRRSTETSFDERLRLDIAYMSNRSLRGDLGIIIGTVLTRCFKGRGF